MTKTDEELCKCMKHVPSLRKSLLSAPRVREKTELMRMLANPTRLQILRLLSEQDLCVCVISSILGRAQANVSQHLSKLRDGKVLESYDAGKLVYYRIIDGRVRKMVGD